MTFRHAPNRRAVLRVAVAAALAIPAASAVTACTSGYDDSPDPLRPLWRRARADAEAADAVARAAPPESEQATLARQVAATRSAHADALWAEVRRLNRPVPERSATSAAQPDPAADGVDGLARRLSEARDEAGALVPALPRHRAGLVGSVAAGCAAAQQLSPSLGARQPGPLDRVATGTLTEEAVSSVQRALAAEHAAVWVYGLVKAFLNGSFDAGIDAGLAAHRDRKNACERVLTDEGTTPRPNEPAYVPPDPVTDATSAMALVITAETDAATAWHGVLERTDDRGLRTLATQALVGSATRCTSWRMEAGRDPAVPALPGRDTELS